MTIRRLHMLGSALATATLAASVLMTGSAAAETPGRDSASANRFEFQKVSFPTDPRFTQLLGINDHGTIAGYHGDENTEMTPNKGFTLRLPNNFTDENFPNSAQTQVVGINNSDDTVGFYIDQAGNTHGFMKEKDKDAQTVDLPGTTFNQLLGINNKDQAAGYFQDNGNPVLQHAYVYGHNGDFLVLHLPMPSSQATSINDRGTVVGFEQTSTVDTKSTGWMLKDGHVTELQYPGSSFTQALGVNNADDVVGTYTDVAGTMHGFLYHNGNFDSIDVDGATSTVINGINNHNQIVGFFMDAVGNTMGAVGERDRS